VTVALLIPCYNAAPFLADLLDGAKAQTVPFDEILCYDDGSTDDTAAYARRLGATVIAGSENRGPACARNQLLAATCCDWVHFHDADDLIDPRFVERMNAAAAGGNEPVLCAMHVEDRATRQRIKTTSYRPLPAAEDPVSWLIQHNGFAIVGLYPVAVLRAVGGFDEILRGNEDPDLHVRLALAGVRFRVCDEPLVTNLVRPDSFSSLHWTACLTDRVRCLERYAESATDFRRAAIGIEALSTAEALLEHGATVGARAAIQLAKRCGVMAVDSPRWLPRAASRLLGPEAIFRARHWRRDHLA